MDDLNRMVSETIRASAAQTAKNIAAVRALNNVLAGIKPRPRTRWERVQGRLREYRGRVVTAWRVLRGDDIHEDCYD